jgi:D-beta-D-heptose 7-phosphate kinase/D-beta-D-heptose 1-phosphate adenosyltransferase
VHVRDVEDRPGGAANVALNTNALGAKTTLMGMIGDDSNGEKLESLLIEQGVTCIFQRLASVPTITKLRVMSRSQQLLRVDFEEEPQTFSVDEQLEKFKMLLPTVDIIVLSDYRKGTLQNARALIAAAREQDVPVLVDPKQDSFAFYEGATLLTPNMKEFQEAAGKVNSLKELETKALEQIEKNHFEAILITRSEDGMSLIQKGEPPVHTPSQALAVYDVTGAGDTVIATLACAMAADQSWPRAVALANLAAGISVSKVGAATVTVPEFRRALHIEHLSGGSVVSKEELKILVEDAKVHGETVVMTNGCFDILHAGHIAYLGEAKKLGNRLIVAVNDNASVQRLKGASRPINDLEQRMAVLAGLKAIDWVVPFSEDTPEQLIADILPDVLVKGGDYQVKDIAGAKQVIANGGSVKILCFQEGVSTTGIINRVLGEKI